MFLFEFKNNDYYKYISIFICIVFLLLNGFNSLIQNLSCSEDIESTSYTYSSNIADDINQPLQLSAIKYDVTSCTCDATCDCCQVLMVTMTSETINLNIIFNQENIVTTDFISLSYILNSENPPPIFV